MAPTKEDPRERVNQELIELLNELRVALPGVQVLFAFLLIVPFQSRFDQLDANDRGVYFAAVALTATSLVLLVAPSAHHRLLFRRVDKEAVLRTANVLAIAGLLALAPAMGAAVYVVTSLLYGDSWAWWVAGAVTVVTALVWFAVPVLLRTESPPPRGEETRA